MRRFFFIGLLFVCIPAIAQDNSTWVRAFPITDYMIDLNDSIKLVQVELPDDLQFKEKQLGVTRGGYKDKQEIFIISPLVKTTANSNQKRVICCIR